MKIIGIALIFSVLGASLAAGLFSEQSSPSNCATIIARELKDKAALQHALESALDESAREVALTDVCKGLSPEECENARIGIVGKAAMGKKP